MADKTWVYIPEENRYILSDKLVTRQDPFERTFKQAAVFHTSEDIPLSITRAYNLEKEICITDYQLNIGARARGQQIGDVSGGKWTPDITPEDGN